MNSLWGSGPQAGHSDQGWGQQWGLRKPGSPYSTRIRPRTPTVAEGSITGLVGIPLKHPDLSTDSKTGLKSSSPGLLPTTIQEGGSVILWSSILSGYSVAGSLSRSSPDSVSSGVRALPSSVAELEACSKQETTVSFPGSDPTELEAPSFVLPVLPLIFQHEGRPGLDLPTRA